MKYQKNKLNDTDVRHAKPESKAYKLADGGGLCCVVLPSGGKSWRYNYRFNNKQKTLTFGTYPDIGVSDARKLCDAAKVDIKNNIDPARQKQISKYASSDTSFQGVAEDWYTSNTEGWSASHADRVQRYLLKDIYPMIGARDIAEIEAPEMIQIIRSIVDRGALDVAKRVKSYMQQVFDYAIVFGYVRRNPARDINLKMVVPPRIKESFSAITEPVAAGELLRRIDGYHGSVQVKTALRLAPLFWLRPSELVGAEWSEFNFDAAQWILPARRRKLPTHVKKANRPEDALTVPLCRQALKLLDDLKPYTGRGRFVFPSIKDRDKPITTDSIRTALRSLGYSKEEMTTHGFRSMARTMLEEMGYPEKMLELQLGHKWGTSVQRSYDRTEGIEQRTEIMKVWGDYLDSLRNGADVIPIRHRA